MWDSPGCFQRCCLASCSFLKQSSARRALSTGIQTVRTDIGLESDRDNGFLEKWTFTFLENGHWTQMVTWSSYRQLLCQEISQVVEKCNCYHIYCSTNIPILIVFVLPCHRAGVGWGRWRHYLAALQLCLRSGNYFLFRRSAVGTVPSVMSAWRDGTLSAIWTAVSLQKQRWTWLESSWECL